MKPEGFFVINDFFEFVEYRVVKYDLIIRNSVYVKVAKK